MALAELEENLVDQVLTETLPLVGDRFAAAFDNNVAGFRYVNTLRTAIVGGLATLTAGPDYSPSQVASPINSRLTSAGFASGSAVTVTTVNDQVQLAFVTSDAFSAAAVPIGSDFGLPNLDLDLLSPANASCGIAVTLRFTAGVDASGFYLETNAPNTLFTINTTTTVPTTLNAPVRFAKLPFRLNDDTSPRSNVTANFVLTLLDPDNDAKIRNGELAGSPDLLDATVAGTAALNFTITSDLPSLAALPKIRTDLSLSWGYATPLVVDPDDDNETFGNAPALALNNNGIQVRSFFDSFTHQVLHGIAEVTSPLDDLIAVFTTEIPLLSDLGSDAVTLLDIAGASPAEVDALEALAKLSSLSQSVSGMTTADNVWANMGSFAWSGDLRTATLSDLQGVPTAPPANFSGDLASFLADAGAIPGLAFPLLKTAAGVPNGQAVADVLMGRPADLFTYNSGKVTVQDGFNVSYPVLGPVFVTLGGFAGVSAQFGFGFDTEGIFDYAEAGPNATTSMIFNGFYATAADEEGEPFTGISVFGGITAGVEANIGIAAVGAEGDITLEVGLYLDSAIGDQNGRIRGDTIHSMPFEDLFRAAGSVSAGLRVYVEVGVGPFSVGYDWESPRATLINFDDWDDDVPVLAEPDPGNTATLILNVGDRAPRRIYGIIDDRAEEFAISAGANGLVVAAFNEENTFAAPALIIGNPNQEGDVIGLEPDLNIPARLHGGGGRDFLRGGAAADELHGDAGPDKLEGRGGNDTLRAGDENDELLGGPGADILDGGPGEDTASWADALAPITIDLRDGTFTGDAALDTLISIERYKGSGFADTIHGSEGFDGLLHGEAGNDLIHGHGDDDFIEGGAGDDTLFGDTGNDLINGGYGADTIDGGDGTDTLSYLSPSPNLPPGVVLEPVTVNLQTGLGTLGEAAGDVVSGFEILIGSGVPAGVTHPASSGDDLTGSDNGDTILGMGGADLIHGGGGNDVLYGDTPDATAGSILTGFDADTIYGDAGDDQIFGQSDNDKLYGGDGNDSLDGGEGDDTLDAGAGDDTLLGGIGNDHLVTSDPIGSDVLDGGPGYNRLSADYSDKTTPLTFTVGPDNAHVFPDGDGFSLVQTLGSLTAGSTDDVIRLSASQEPALYHKSINAGPGTDLVIADWRGFYPVGTSGSRTNDQLHGGDGNDTLSFEQSSGGVTVNLSTNTTGGFAAGIVITGFENLTGTNFHDTLTGDAGPNVFQPLSNGRTNQTDFFEGDWIYGEGGVDTLRLDFSSNPVANLDGIIVGINTVRIPGFQGVNPLVNEISHSLNSIEQFEIIGSDAPDNMMTSGGVFADILYGGGGSDVLNARGGDDLLDGGEGDDVLGAAGGNDIVRGGPGNDVITAGSEVTDAGGLLGSDVIEGGTGDDFISDWRGVPVSGISVTPGAGTILKLDGGPGYDSLTADFSKQTQAIHFDPARPSDHSFPDGSWFRGFEKLVDFVTGEGNDVLIFYGRENNSVRLQGGNDTLAPGLGRDDVSGGAGNDLLILDFSQGEGPGVGPVTSTVSISNVTSTFRRVIPNTNTVVDLTTHSYFESIHLTGSSKDDDLAGSPGNDVIHGGTGADTLRGLSGNDWLDGGPGADEMTGGGGFNTVVVDHPDDLVYDPDGGIDTVRAGVDFTLIGGVENLVLTGGAVNGTGNTSKNVLTGNAQNNYLQGGAQNDILNGGGGANEVDRLNGGAHADTFVLGEGSVRFYDAGDAGTPGHGGYALIEDFTPSQMDKLRLAGSAAQYFLGASPVPGVTGTGLFHDSNASGVLDATDELIAILASTESLTPANTLGTAVIVNVAPLASAGVTSEPHGLLFDSGAGKRMHLQFTMVEPGLAGVIIEIMASDDLGIDDPWTTIASKTGSAAWTGYGAVTPGLPADGQVNVSVADIEPASTVTRRFLRLKVTVP